MELSLFKHKSPDFAKLENYGFKVQNGAYAYCTQILQGQFNLTVKVNKDGAVDTLLIDTATDEPYTLHLVEGAGGSFVGAVRAEFEEVLISIAEKCFNLDIFKGEIAHGVINYVKEKYGDELEYLWEKFPDNAVWRRKDNKKWYGAILTVSKRKLGLNDDCPVHIIDLRIKTEEIATLVDNKKYFAGYHMNKQHWFTMCLDGSVPLQEIFKRIDESYDLAKK